MLVSCWSVKGGSGTTVVAAALAVVLSRRADGGAVLVDLAGDAPAVLGLADLEGPGVAEWLRAGPEVPDDGLVRIEHEVVAGLTVVPRGDGGLDALDRAEALAAALASDGRAVVVDCGRLDRHERLGAGGVARVLATSATHSLLVTRPCYLSLRRAVSAPITPSAVVVVDEPGRALGAADVRAILGVPLAAAVAVDPAVARAVDAGLLASRLPRTLARALREVP